MELGNPWSLGPACLPSTSATEHEHLQFLSHESGDDVLFTVVEDMGSPTDHFEPTKSALEANVFSNDVIVEKYYHYTDDVRLVEDVKLEGIDGSDLDGSMLSETAVAKEEYRDDINIDNGPQFTIIESGDLNGIVQGDIIELKETSLDVEDLNSIKIEDNNAMKVTSRVTNGDKFFSENNLLNFSNDLAIPTSVAELSTYPNIVLGFLDGAEPGKAVRLKIHKVNRLENSSELDIKQSLHNMKTDEPVKCKECDIYFKKTEDLKAHMEAHLVKLQNSCPLCSVEFPSKSALQLHIRQHFTKSQGCNLCSERFASKSLLRSHKLQKHITMSNSQGSVNFNKDNITVNTTATSVLNNIPVTTPSTVSTTTVAASTTNKIFKCSLCKSMFCSRSELKQHSTTHWQKPFKCEQCGATFTQNGSLQVHIRRHRGEKPFTCDLCGNSYTRAFSLKVHMKTHTGEKPHNCEYCSSSFITSSHLNVHRRIHTGERPFSCSECSATFITTSHLNVHKRIHLLTSPAPVRCITCNISFRDNTQLRLHRKAYHQQNKKKKTNNHPSACRCKQCFKTTSSNNGKFGKSPTLMS